MRGMSTAVSEHSPQTDSPQTTCTHRGQSDATHTNSGNTVVTQWCTTHVCPQSRVSLSETRHGAGVDTRGEREVGDAQSYFLYNSLSYFRRHRLRGGAVTYAVAGKSHPHHGERLPSLSRLAREPRRSRAKQPDDSHASSCSSSLSDFVTDLDSRDDVPASSFSVTPPTSHPLGESLTARSAYHDLNSSR